MKIAVLFPGIGYHCDKPLLYYGAKIAGQYQYEVCKIPYADLSRSMEEAFRQAFAQTEEYLAQVDWHQYEEILFISKSIGTVVAAAYAQKYSINCRNVYYTPVKQTFDFTPHSGIVFHGTDDSWVDTPTVREKCQENDLPLHVIEGADHSLEVKGDAQRTIGILRDVMKLTQAYIADRI